MESATSSLPLKDVLEHLDIKSWDLILFGDGSGSRFGRGMGWACVAIDRSELRRRLFYGSANDGTVNNAELLAYLVPLTWYAAKTAGTGPKQVHIITDSEFARSTGEGRPAPKNTVLWAAYRQLARHNLVLHWHWLPRSTTGLNNLCDHLGRAARVMIESAGLPETVEVKHGLHPDRCNT